MILIKVGPLQLYIKFIGSMTEEVEKHWSRPLTIPGLIISGWI